jgi:hypothetical protein
LSATSLVQPVTQASRSLPRSSLACAFDHRDVGKCRCDGQPLREYGQLRGDVGALLRQRRQPLFDRRDSLMRRGRQPGRQRHHAAFQPGKLCFDLGNIGSATDHQHVIAVRCLPRLEQHERRQLAQQRAGRQHQQAHLQFRPGTGEQMQIRPRVRRALQRRA